jgi:hypothetical protein
MAIPSTVNHEGLAQGVRDHVPGVQNYAYEGAWHALWDLLDINPGTYNERMLIFINCQLGAEYPDLPGAQQAFATSRGLYDWSALNQLLITSFAGTFLEWMTLGLEWSGQGLSWFPPGGGTMLWAGDQIDWLIEHLQWGPDATFIPLIHCIAAGGTLTWRTIPIAWGGNNLNWS